MAEYRGKHIVKHEKKNGITVETYVEFEEGQVYLNTYVNFKLYSRVHVADLASKDIAADVVPVKHGHWRQVDENKCECSNCGIIVLIAVYPHGDKNYCPNCGAKMDGGDNP